MHEAVSEIIARRRVQPEGLNRLMTQSIAVHVTAIVLLFVVPRSWFVRETEKPMLMSISLSGSPGEKSGGMVSAGARQVDTVAPPKPNQPIRPTTQAKPDEIAVPVKPLKPTPKPVEKPTGTTSPQPRLGTPGTQVQKGTAVADTGSTSQSTGLTFGGGAGGATMTLDSNFCCPEYANEVLNRIRAKWDRAQPESGIVTVVFEINRDGTFSKPVVETEKSSASLSLRLASQGAFTDLKLQPLPKEYPSDKLKIHLTFPYVR